MSRLILLELKVVFLHLMKFNGLPLSLESQCLPKDSWNSGTIVVNFHFQAGHGTYAPNPGLSR